MKPSRLLTMRFMVRVLGCVFALAAPLAARTWKFPSVSEPLEAEFVGMANGMVVLRGANGTSCEIPFANFSKSDQEYLRGLTGQASPANAADPAASKPVTSRNGYKLRKLDSARDRVVDVESATELHITGEDDPLAGATIRFTAPDGWLFLEKIPPSVVLSKHLDRFLVDGKPAVPDRNLRVTRHLQGSVVIPHGSDFPGLVLFDGKSLEGRSLPLPCHVPIGDAKLGTMGASARSLLLKRGYMATLATEADGGGFSRNYVAQDHDVCVDALPAEFAAGIRFVRVFPWRWTGKKGIAGGIGRNLALDWFYNWNISDQSSPDREYVPIRQNRHWPGLNQDWKRRGATHLLGFNEPDRPDQAKMTVDEAIQGWPALLATGLRLGSPATSDGGLPWLYEFIRKADEKKLRVDFVAVHYYRATNDPGDAKGAANQLERFLKEIHSRVKRPLWVTEWNNGASWTKPADPNPRQQRAAIQAMIEMMDEAPYVERYALYNWVEDARRVEQNDGSLTPAGEAYRDQVSPLSFTQPKLR